GRNLFISKMDAVIDNVVAIIGRGMAEAKAEIANGRKRIQDYIAQLPQDLQAVGQEAADNIQSQFDQLEQSVNDKQNALIDTLASKYQEHLQAVDARIEEMKAANAGLIDKALNAIVGVIKVILELKEMLLNVLARVADAIGKIISAPIEFLGNLIGAIKQGFSQFIDNIGTHLQQGFIAWLTGTLGGAGITLPQTFDLPGILQLVMQILGISFEQIMGKVSQVLGIDIMGIYGQIMELVNIYQEQGMVGLAKYGLERLIGADGVEALMEVVRIFEVIQSGDFGQLWEIIQQHLSDLKEMIFGKIEEFIVERVVKAGITWLLSLFNPAGAFIRACKMIYDVVMFFIERGSQIMSLVNAIIDSIASIASGNIGAAANFIEQALAKAIPVAISFLSSLLGLGNISEKVQEIIQAVRTAVDGAIDKVLNSRPVQMVAGFIKRVIGRITSFVQRGAARVGSALGLGGEEAPPEQPSQAAGPDERTTEQKQADVEQAVMEATQKLEPENATPETVRAELPAIQSRYRLTSLTLVDEADGEYHIEGTLNPKGKGPSKKLDKGRSGNGRFSYLEDPPGVAAGKDFTSAQKAKIIEEWRKILKEETGVAYICSEQSGTRLCRPKKSMRGVTPRPNEWQIDHIIPRDQDGNNSYANAQVLSRRENREKSNTYEED
ncbi:MAG TPA: HNH endonuclease domain-containing protein, partial [Chloroflexota bacterium]|nr:HNH endonuclease domain-containing protein [Chloroflexota bacterium]